MKEAYMKKLAMTAAMVSAVALLSMAAPSSAHAQDAFTFSFNTGNVAFAYSDGYWDNERRWHRWRDAREAREFRKHHGHRYYHRKHTSVHNRGWRDQDRDGVPNRHDRDRDGDGVPNRFDDAPRNPHYR